MHGYHVLAGVLAVLAVSAALGAVLNWVSRGGEE